MNFTEEQLNAYSVLTKLQKGISLNTIAGESPADAHRNAGGKCKNESQRRLLGGQILANPNVVKFMALMAVEPASEIALAVASRDEILEGLTIIARTTIDDVASFTSSPCIDMDNGIEVLNSSVHVKSIDDIPHGARTAIKSVKQTKFGLEITMYDTLTARKQIAEMCGYNQPIKTEHSGSIDVRNLLSDFYE
jgi:phage terminase small subunit